MAKLIPFEGFKYSFGRNNSSLLVLIGLSVFTLIGSLPLIASVAAFNADLYAQGEWWRPFSAWLCQLNFAHWAINQWGLVVMAILLPKKMTPNVVLGFFAVWLVSSLCLMSSDYQGYVGLSGLLYGWLVIAAVVSPYYSNAIKALFILMISGKVFLENGLLFGIHWHSELLENLLQSSVAHESHLWGLLSGLMFVSVLQVFRWIMSSGSR